MRESKRLHFGYVLIAACSVPPTHKSLKPWCHIFTTHPKILDWLDAHGNTAAVFALTVQGKTLEAAMNEASDSIGKPDKPAKRQRKNVMQKSDVTKETLRHKLSDEISEHLV